MVFAISLLNFGAGKKNKLQTLLVKMSQKIAISDKMCVYKLQSCHISQKAKNYPKISNLSKMDQNGSKSEICVTQR
jgi:hypothetical protein